MHKAGITGRGVAGRGTRYLPEAVLWIVGLVSMALLQPDQEHLFSFCPFSYVLEWCPGCGLGHAIAWLVRGEFRASWEAHPLGLPAVLILSWRCVQLIRLHDTCAQQR